MELLENRSLAAVMAAELVSLTGAAMTFVALPWFVLVTTGSTARMGWVLAAELLPVGVFGIPCGAIVARLGAKRTMNIADAARAPLVALIPILHWTGHLSFPLLLGITFASGCFLAPYYASSRLILPEVVGDDEQVVAQGSAFVQAVTQLTQLGGPIIGGLLIAWIGAPKVLLIDAATYAFSFVVIFTFVRAGKRVPQDDSSRGLLAGVRYLVHDRLLGPTLAAAAVVNFVAQGLVATLPVLVFRRYGADAKVVGFLFAAFGGARVADRAQDPAVAARCGRDRGDGLAALAADRVDAVVDRDRRDRRVRGLRAARERADDRRAHRAHARRVAAEGDDRRDDDLRHVRPARLSRSRRRPPVRLAQVRLPRRRSRFHARRHGLFRRCPERGRAGRSGRPRAGVDAA
ncbi:MAG: MFS transporter [Actinobacteria bacterium]|nr:MAG: MFS transporter [Actinomycetota bacterium]